MTRTVTPQTLVSFRGNDYSVSPDLCGAQVQVRHRLGAEVGHDDVDEPLLQGQPRCGPGFSQWRDGCPRQIAPVAADRVGEHIFALSIKYAIRSSQVVSVRNGPPCLNRLSFHEGEIPPVAQQTIVQMVDDLDGSQTEDVTTVSFGLDGVTYEIDLSEANAANLRKSVEDFVTHARRTGGRLKPGTGAKSNSAATASHEQAQAIREWARRNGHEVSNRGRIPASLIEAFEAAQAEASTTTRKRRAKTTTS